MNTACLICKGGADRDEGYGAPNRYRCHNCGCYSATKIVESELIADTPSNFTQKAPALALERKMQGRDNYELGIDDNRVVTCNGIPFLDDYPGQFPEKMQRGFMNLARELKFSPLYSVEEWRLCENIFFPNGENNIREKMLSLFEQEGLIDREVRDPRSCVSLTVKGVNKALENDISKRDTAFLAMWFSEPLEKEYSAAVSEAVAKAGYKLSVVNQVHHNEFIMNKVLNLVKESRFVIADLTSTQEDTSESMVTGGVRGGVYFEAGYARGLGLEVILTCKEDPDAQKRIHFDAKQINTIFWKKAESPSQHLICGSSFDFVEYLTERIIATVGKGPRYVPERDRENQRQV